MKTSIKRFTAFKILLLSFLFASVEILAQSQLVKPKSLTTQQFIDSISHQAEYCHPHIYYKTPDKKTNYIFYFLRNSNYSGHSANKPEMAIDHSYILVNALSTSDGIHYYLQVVDSLYDHFAGDFELKIETVFFANCDTIKDKELFITFSNPFVRLESSGVYYHTWVYQFPDTNNTHWKKDNYFSNIFNEGSSSERNLADEQKNGVKTDARTTLKYNSAQKILAVLKQMGY